MPIPLKPGELEIIAKSTDTKEYKCGHTGAASFRLSMGTWDIISPEIRQDAYRPDCIFNTMHANLHRCPVCKKVYEVVPNSNSVSKSSFYHLLECFPTIATSTQSSLGG